jgi:hypothetical protein
VLFSLPSAPEAVSDVMKAFNETEAIVAKFAQPAPPMR